MKKGKTKRSPEMTLYCLLTILIGGVLLIWGLIKIQWVEGDMWRKKAEVREKSFRTEPARRGNIYSSDGKILATTVPVCNLYLDFGKELIKNKEGHIVADSFGHAKFKPLIADTNYQNYVGEVCRILHEANPSKSVNWYYQKINDEYSKPKASRCFLVQRDVPYSYWKQICKLPGWNRIVVKTVDGQNVQRDIRRHTYGNLAACTIGFRNGLKTTYSGLEGHYDSLLRGQDGQFLCRRLTKGVWLPMEEGSYEGDTLAAYDSTFVRPVINGKHIVSTIDTRYQDIAESSLRKSLKQYGGRSGCAVLMEMNTGYILACSNLTYDTSKHEYLEITDHNIAVSDIGEPGSTFKAVILAGMMEAPNTHIDTAMKFAVPQNGSKAFPGKDNTIRDDHTLPGRDSLSVSEIIAQSSNIGMCQLGWTYFNQNGRRDTLKNSVKRIFPFDKLHVDLMTPESRTHINNLYESNRDFSNFCYGYSTTVSALQILTFYNALGAGGRMVKPLFCKEIIDGNEHKVIEPIVMKEQMCSPQTIAILKDLLVGVVEHGTGNNIKNNTYGIAGKTGTTNPLRGNGRHNGSFAGFFPAENPKYSCIVVIKDSPAYGRQAAPIFKDIADCVMAIDKTLGNIEAKTGQGKWVNGMWVADTNQRNTHKAIPYLPKGNQQEIFRISNYLGLPFYSSDSNSIWATYVPGVDSLHTRGHYQSYSLTSGVVPDCKGMTAKDAVALLTQAGYKVRLSGVGKVVRQEPRARTKVKQGATIVIQLQN